MGIPLDSVGGQGSPPRQNMQENHMGSGNQQQNDYPTFEDTFKSRQPTDNSGNPQPPAEVPFDDQPVGGGNSQAPGMMAQDFSAPANMGKPEAFAVDFSDNGPQEMASEPHMDSNAAQAEVTHPSAPIDPNVVNVDEIQIKPKQQLTFEELLEKELNEKENNENVLPKDDDRVIRKPKKEFLKRTTKKTTIPKEKQGGKKYKYYADHFGGKKKPQNNSGSEIEKSDGSKSNTQSKTKIESDEGNKEEMETKAFLSKGAGVGGGKRRTAESGEKPTSPQKNEDEEEGSGKPWKNRRGRKARGQNNNSSIDDRKDSLEEFEVLEEN